MQRRIAWAGAVAFVVVGLAVAYTGWRLVQAQGPDVCRVCQRPVHAHSKTVALVDGKREVFCCPACALSERHEAGRNVQILSLTDLDTGAPLAPAQAYMVRGSDLNPCVHQNTRVDENMHPVAMEYDRCAPSLLAFASQDAAARFAAAHGGQVLKAGELR